MTNCTLDSVNVYGISAWELIGEPASQKNLRISSPGEPWLSADRIDVAQFLYLLVRNSKLRDVISVLSSKSMLILGRFSVPRKINALADGVRARDMLSIVFDWEPSPQRETLAQLQLRCARVSIRGPAPISKPSSTNSSCKRSRSGSKRNSQEAPPALS